MNKKLLGGIALIAFAAIVGMNVKMDKQECKVPVVNLANVEALAVENDDDGYSCSATAKCFHGGREEGSVSCTGTKMCTSAYGSVTCDAKTSSCM